MPQYFKELSFNTSDKSIINITEDIERVINEFSVINGLINLSILHTSCSLMVQENADPLVQQDILNFLEEIAPEKKYFHSSEGPDDMPAHLKSLITQTHLSLSIKNKKLILGIWQGIFIIEHRISNNLRNVLIHIMEV